LEMDRQWHRCQQSQITDRQLKTCADAANASAIWQLPKGNRAAQEEFECSERSRQVIENKYYNLKHRYQSRHVTENKRLIRIKPSGY
jgi:hypothetical protein